MIDHPVRHVARSDSHFAPIAADYATSRLHAEGVDLARMVAVANQPPGARLLDVGTGAGHAGLAFAAAGCAVTGLDLTGPMLRAARDLAAQRDLALTAVQGLAEAMPFSAAAFDAVACRYCAHHFRDLPRAISEMRRVLASGGCLIFVDHVAPEDDAADTFINHLDWLRDPSHRREPRLSEYHDWCAAHGLAIELVEPWRERIWVDDWFTRARTAPDREAKVRAMLAGAPPRLRETFGIVDEPLSFELHVVLLRCRAV